MQWSLEFILRAKEALEGISMGDSGRGRQLISSDLHFQMFLLLLVSLEVGRRGKRLGQQRRVSWSRVVGRGMVRRG